MTYDYWKVLKTSTLVFLKNLRENEDELTPDIIYWGLAPKGHIIKYSHFFFVSDVKVPKLGCRSPTLSVFRRWAQTLARHDVESIYGQKRENIATKIDTNLPSFDS